MLASGKMTEALSSLPFEKGATRVEVPFS